MEGWQQRARIGRLASAAYRYLVADASGRRALRRKWYFEASGHMTPFLATTVQEGTLLFRTDDVDIGRGTFVDGLWDEQMIDAAIRIAETHGATIAGRAVLEIGANIGTTTLLLLNRYGASNVIAFEPVPDTAHILRAMIALNGLEGRVDVHEVALTDRETILEMELSPRSAGDHRVRVATTYEGALGEDHREVTHVRGAALDSELDSLDDVALVWMDAQGHEGQVLAGATKLLASPIPILTEFWPYGLRRANGLETFLRLAEQHFTHVVDTAHGQAQSSSAQPISALRNIANRYSAPDDVTDFLLLTK